MSAAGAGWTATNRYFRVSENANESPQVHQRITVILIQQDDGYFMPKISIFLTYEREK